MIGLGLLLVAAGAVARFAASPHYEWAGDLNLHTIGVILMIVGGIGLLYSLILLAVVREPGPDDYLAEEEVVDDPELGALPRRRVRRRIR